MCDISMSLVLLIGRFYMCNFMYFLMNILFVCHGNICRSPMAHAIAKTLYPDWNIESCGVSKFHNGEPMDRRAAETLKQHDMYVPVTSQHITEFNADDFDLVLAMDFSNIVRLDSFGVKAKYVTFLTDKREVGDPYYDDSFERVFQQLLEAIKSLENYSKE